MKRILILQDGTIFRGQGLGSNREVVCEIVFNTAMAGYIEAITDPSYVKQAIVMTYPLIGNYGFMEEDSQSEKPWAEALIAREICEHDNNFRSQGNLEKYLDKHDIPALYDIDTRELTKILRDKGTMLGLITDNIDIDIDTAMAKINSHKVCNHVELVSRKDIKQYGKNGRYNVALIDLGVKKSIIDLLLKRECKVIVYPWDTDADTILDTNPDGIVFSNGPGNPKDCKKILPEIKKIYDTETPIFAICLGHQLLALANGADTTKLKYGHIGDNQSVKDLENGKLYVTAQNHNYVIDENTLDSNIAKVNFINVNDKTVEGIRYIHKNILSVQFRPDGCPGPQETEYLFDEFISNMK